MIAGELVATSLGQVSASALSIMSGLQDHKISWWARTSAGLKCIHSPIFGQIYGAISLDLYHINHTNMEKTKYMPAIPEADIIAHREKLINMKIKSLTHYGIKKWSSHFISQVVAVILSDAINRNKTDFPINSGFKACYESLICFLIGQRWHKKRESLDTYFRNTVEVAEGTPLGIVVTAKSLWNVQLNAHAVLNSLWCWMHPTGTHF